MSKAYAWAAQALEAVGVPIGAEEVEVGVEVIVWAATRVKPAARTRVVSCMVYSRKTFAIGLEQVYRIRRKQYIQ
jgi:hypothetical protein